MNKKQQPKTDGLTYSQRLEQDREEMDKAEAIKELEEINKKIAEDFDNGVIDQDKWHRKRQLLCLTGN